MPTRIVPVPCLSDNYAYLVIDDAARRAAVVDPGEAPPVLAAIEREGVELVAVWATHRHLDHVGGVAGLVGAIPGLAVVCHSSDFQRGHVPHATHSVGEGEIMEVGAVRATIIHNPGHTIGGISYWIEDDGAGGAVFTGDTLFAAGCGRLFEGTAEMMFASMAKLAALPPTTKVYFGHEYTAANLKFAAAAEPDNADVAAKVERVAAMRARGEATTPSTIGDERATNPFVRAKDAAELGARRAWKDTFK